MGVFEVDCNFIWFKESAMNAFRFVLYQNRKNFKTEFFKNQKEIAVLFHSSLQISAVFFMPLSGAAVAVERPCSLCSVSREQLTALHTRALRGSKKSIRRPHRSFKWKPQPHRTATRIWKPHRRKPRFQNSNRKPHRKNMVTPCETRTVKIMVHRLVQFNYPSSSNQSFPVSINHAFTKKPQGNLA